MASLRYKGVEAEEEELTTRNRRVGMRRLTYYRCALIAIANAFATEICSPALTTIDQLKFVQGYRHRDLICRMTGALLSRAASRDATTVDEEVTFWIDQQVKALQITIVDLLWLVWRNYGPEHNRRAS